MVPGTALWASGFPSHTLPASSRTPMAPQATWLTCAAPQLHMVGAPPSRVSPTVVWGLSCGWGPWAAAGAGGWGRWVLTLVALGARLAGLVVVHALIVEAVLAWDADGIVVLCAAALHPVTCGEEVRGSSGGKPWLQVTTCQRVYLSRDTHTPSPAACPHPHVPISPGPMSPQVPLPYSMARPLTWLALVTALVAVGVGVPGTVLLGRGAQHEPQEQESYTGRPGRLSPHAHPRLTGGRCRSLGFSLQDVAIRAAEEGRRAGGGPTDVWLSPLTNRPNALTPGRIRPSPSHLVCTHPAHLSHREVVSPWQLSSLDRVVWGPPTRLAPSGHHSPCTGQTPQVKWRGHIHAILTPQQKAHRAQGKPRQHTGPGDRPLPVWTLSQHQLQGERWQCPRLHSTIPSPCPGAARTRAAASSCVRARAGLRG